MHFFFFWCGILVGFASFLFIFVCFYFFYFFLISYIQKEKEDLDLWYLFGNTMIYGISYATNIFRGFFFLLGVKMRFGWLSDVLEEW